MPQDEPAKVACHCSDHEVLPPAVPIPTVNPLQSIVLGPIETAMLLDLPSGFDTQSLCVIDRRTVESRPPNFSQICLNHWLI